jgi:diguanylate cyclase
MGGDEFAVLLPNASLRVAIKVADRLLNDVRENELMSKYGVTLSIGVCQYSFKETQRDFAKRIDGLMYEAKKRGKNQMVYKEEV